MQDDFNFKSKRQKLNVPPPLLDNNIVSLGETENAEIFLKPKRRVNDYESFSNNPPEHLVRHGWDTSFNFSWPEDYGLGIESSIDRSKMPSQFQEIFLRFVNLGFIDEYGGSCVLMSAVLRRILRLHGFAAHTKQAICYWNNEGKGQKVKVGLANQHGPLPGPSGAAVDLHMITTCEGYVLDFSLKPVQSIFGYIAPRALIGLDRISDEYQDFGIGGEAAWVDVKPQNPIVKHLRLEQRDIEHALTRDYFRVYQF